MKNKGTRMPRNRARMPLKGAIEVRQVEDSGGSKRKLVIDRPLGNRACCCFIGK